MRFAVAIVLAALLAQAGGGWTAAAQPPAAALPPGASAAPADAAAAGGPAAPERDPAYTFRDPFWPPGFWPTLAPETQEVAVVVATTTGVVVHVPEPVPVPVPVPAAKPNWPYAEKEIAGQTRGVAQSAGRYTAYVLGDIRFEGDQVSLTASNIVYHFLVHRITRAGPQYKRVDWEPVEKND